ncbi:hypothetical protein Q5P01_008556 [Channa striata]|uniref:Uncharacterized protein n=1 Tax=Channa striata TaxID=64152 RepID=A0AA88MZT1_CHASR|nr:hypothetical protein Q5P01_008556 [Channa striata]
MKEGKETSEGDEGEGGGVKISVGDSDAEEASDGKLRETRRPRRPLRRAAPLGGTAGSSGTAGTALGDTPSSASLRRATPLCPARRDVSEPGAEYFLEIHGFLQQT